MRRVLSVIAASFLLMTGSVRGTTLGNDQTIALSCSDGNEVTLTVDAQTLLDLTGALEAMSGSGLTCTLTQLPPVAYGLGLTAVASSGSKDFAVGGGQYLAASGECGGAFTVNIGFSAHVDSSGTTATATTATGSLSETISQPGGICNGDRFKLSITCLTVLANKAWMDGPVTQATGAFTFLFDPTSGAAAVQDGPDLYNDTRNTQNCPTPVIQPAVPFIHGNIVVKDNP